MTTNDLIGLIASYVYAFGLLVMVETVGRRLKWPPFVTRKLIHIGAGMWVWGILALFDTWYIGIIPFATFIVMNFVFYRLGTFQQMDDEDATPGTVYFAISITILFTALWRTDPPPPDQVAIAAAAVMIMTWGDALAALLGKRFGRWMYRTFGHERTVEGSVAFLIAAGVAVFFTLTLLPGSPLAPTHAPIAPQEALIITAAGVTVGAVAEGISPRGLDNLTVPLLSGLIMWLVSRVL